MTLNTMEHIKQLLDSKELASIYRLVNWLISFWENKFLSPSRSFARVPCLQDFRVWNKAVKLCPHSEVTPAAAQEFFSQQEAGPRMKLKMSSKPIKSVVSQPVCLLYIIFIYVRLLF